MPQVAVFAWLAIRGSILTKDNLRRRNVIFVNVCPLCLKAEGSVNHLLMGCDMAQGLWKAFLMLVGCRWVFSLICEHFLGWRFGVGSKRGRILWRFSFLAGCGLFGRRGCEML